MSRTPKRKAAPPAAAAAERPSPVPAVVQSGQIDLAVKPVRRRRRANADFEDRIGYRFKDSALLDQALTHISALTGARNRSGSYQRLEFLGDHVLGLVVSEMLFGAFPRADEGELSRRL